MKSFLKYPKQLYLFDIMNILVIEIQIHKKKSKNTRYIRIASSIILFILLKGWTIYFLKSANGTIIKNIYILYI